MDEQKIPRITIATGDDGFAMELSMNRYLDQVRAKHSQCSIEHFDPASEPIGSFLARAMTASLFQEIRALCVLHAQALTEKELAELDRALDYEIPDVYIFISAEIDKKAPSEAKTNKLNKTLQLKKRAADSSIMIYSFTRPRDYELSGWIMERVPELFKRQIGKPEADLLAETVEYDFIYSELHKIDMALPPGARIDKKTIQEIVGVTRAMTVYELAAALGNKDLVTALNVLDSLFVNNISQAPILVASAVFRHFWALLKIKKFLEKNPAIFKQYNTKGYGKDSPQSRAAFEIGLACGLLTEKDKASNRAFPVIIKSGIVSQSQTFTSSALKNILKSLQRFDVGVKTGRVDPNLCNLQMLCYGVFRGGVV
jgi:DNA polymerase III delta subunit